VCAQSGPVRRQQLLFDLEAFLPMPIEEVTCDTLPLDGDRVLCVGIPTRPTAELMQALAGRGVDVEHLIVDAIAQRPNAEPSGESSARALVDTRWTRVAMRDGRTAVVPTPVLHDVESVHRALRERAMLNGEPLGQLALLDLTEPGARTSTANSADEGGDENRGDGHPPSAVASIAMSAIRSKRCIDLRTAALAGGAARGGLLRLARHCLVLTVILLAIAAVGARLQRGAHRTHIAAIDQARLDAYREAFAADSLPPGSALRLASERIRLEGMTHGKDQAELVRAGEGPLEALREIVATIPPEVRIMLDEVRLDERQVTLRGKTASHRDAERISEAMGKVSGMRVRPPRTTRLQDGGVEFWIVAMRRVVDD
jgi:hypothetical protein